MAAHFDTPVESAPGSLVDSLWLDTLQRIAERGAHELKGALNGVAVNLEVVRSRAEKPDVAASAVKNFANAAVDQLESVIEISEALLALSRPVRLPVELGRVVRAVGSLLVPAARADGRELVLDGPLDALGTTSADGSAARLVIAAGLLAGVEASTRVTCRAVPGDDAPAVRIECVAAAGAAVAEEGESDGCAPMLADDVSAVARSAGIRVEAEPSAMSITFPR